MFSGNNKGGKSHGGKLSTLKRADRKVYELITKEHLRLRTCDEYHKAAFNALQEADGEVYALVNNEYNRTAECIQLVAAENQCSQAVLAALGSVVQNKTAEGFVGARLHGGCRVVDQLEQLAIDRAKQTFKAQYANVQPHSGTTANLIILTALLESGDKILSMGLGYGGHFSHGSAVSFTGKFFNVENYYVDKTSFLLDYDAVRKQALRFRPKLIICGASAYTRTINFETFREIADEVGAYLLADISHISGLVTAGAHPSPIDYAHFTTTSTYKPGGPRGGLILIGKDFNKVVKVSGKESALWEHIEKMTFPGMQGTPYLNHIAAKAVFFKETLSDEYKTRQFKIIENAKRLANNLADLGFDVLTGGTDNHMILVNVSNFRKGLTGFTAQKCLERCNIIIDRIMLPYDKTSINVTNGIRLGTPIVTKRGMGPEQMDAVSELIDTVLKRVEIISEREYSLEESFVKHVRDKVKDSCGKCPMWF